MITYNWGSQFLGHILCRKYGFLAPTPTPLSHIQNLLLKQFSVWIFLKFAFQQKLFLSMLIKKIVLFFKSYITLKIDQNCRCFCLINHFNLNSVPSGGVFFFKFTALLFFKYWPSRNSSFLSFFHYET